MKKSRRKLGVWALGILIVIGVCIIVSTLLYIPLRGRAKNDRPLVLIHNPFNRERISLGEGITVHATARLSGGVERIEFWADDVFVHAQEAQDDALSLLVLNTVWEPVTLGEHVLVVRAFSARGVPGQATIAVKVIEAVVQEEILITHIVAPGESLKSIANDYSVDVGDLTSSATGGDPAPGDLVFVPEEIIPGGSESEPPTEPPSPESSASPPEPEAAAPDSMASILGIWGLEPLVPPGTGEAVSLKIEALALQTDTAYESLHCYVGVGEGDPRWYPDADFDQSTDESFRSLGSTTWNVEEFLADERALIISWPGNQPLPFDVTCEGISGGGTDAVPLGGLNLNIATWDGITRQASSSGDEGSFTLDYRVSRDGSMRVPFILDPSMTPPTNLRKGGWSLIWDYDPRPDEHEIDGFYIYLNGNLQWSEPPEARETYLPYEWYHPPCGEEYNFTATAYYYDEVWEEHESPAAMPAVTFTTGDLGEEACNRAITVTFETLTTEYLGEDEDMTNAVGPAFGSFYVDDQLIGFDGRCDSRGSICTAMPLYHDTEYDIRTWTYALWKITATRIMADVPTGEALTVGFEIWDDDPGGGINDDLICGAQELVPSEDLNTPHSRVISSPNEECRVRVSFNILFGEPVGEPGGEPPLPYLEITDLTVDEATGQLEIHVLNSGAATWPARDLVIMVSWQSGDPIGGYVFPEFILMPGDTTILKHPDLVPGPDPPLGACVLLDPGNEVPEEDDRYRGWSRGYYCRPLPDLTINDVVHDPENERLLVVVENIGQGTIDNRNLDIQINLPDGRSLSGTDAWWTGVSMEPWDVFAFEWPNIGFAREMMSDGYSVVIDPQNDLAEESDDNNQFDVPALNRLAVNWVSAIAPPEYPDTTYTMDVSIISGGTTRNTDQWIAPPCCDDGWECFEFIDHPYYGDFCEWKNQWRGETNFITNWFDIAGEDDLMISISMQPGPRERIIEWSQIFTAEDLWGSIPSYGWPPACVYYAVEGSHSMRFTPQNDFSTNFNICWYSEE